MERFAREVSRKFGIAGQMDARVGTDFISRTCTTTVRSGQTWEEVAYRATADARSGYVINMEETANMQRHMAHRLESGPRILMVILLFTNGRRQNEHK